jgi:hypothetical protein
VKLDFNEIDVDLRVQLYIRSRAKINIGYQSSIFELICRYSKICCIEMETGARENYFDNITYL